MYGNYIAAAHTEGKGALHIRDTGSNGGVLYHNNTDGTCNYCDKQLSTLLPEGKMLTVVPPENAVAPNAFWHDKPTVYVGNNNTPKPNPRGGGN